MEGLGTASESLTELMVCCSLRKVQAVAQRIADGLAILQMLADDQGAATAGRLSEQQRDDLAKMTLRSWAAGQDGDRLARELLWKLLRSGALFPHVTHREVLLGRGLSLHLTVPLAVGFQASRKRLAKMTLQSWAYGRDATGRHGSSYASFSWACLL